MQPSLYDKVNVYKKSQSIQSEIIPANSRETDARALMACANRLRAAKKLMESGDPKSRDNLKAYGDAIRTNQELWTIFQVAVVDPENQLPVDLKSTLFSLSRFVDKTSFGAIGHYAPDMLDELININLKIAEGLNKKPEGAEPEVLSPPAMDPKEVPVSLCTSA